MRITENEISTIKNLAQKIFGQGTLVYLFGSRVDNDKKGGDIDLFITNKEKTNLTILKKIEFLAELKLIIGEQKIDVILDNSITRQKKQFYHTITQQAVEI
jgi:predicted nucleotidyltransferase